MWLIYAMFYAGLDGTGMKPVRAELVTPTPFKTQKECMDARPHRAVYMKGQLMVLESCSFVEVLPTTKG